MFEQVRLGQRPFHGFLQAVLHLEQATNGVPSNLGHLDVNLAKGGRFDVSNGLFEVVHADLHLLEDLGR